MRFKYFAIILLALTVMWGCQQNSGSTNESESSSTQELEQEQMQGQQPAPATDVSDEEMKQFVSVAQELQTISQEAQQIMVNTINQVGLEVDRFDLIQQAQADPSLEVDVTDEEMAKYEAAMQELEKIQMEAQQEMQEVIQAEGLTENRYQQIGMALQSDPALQQKFQEIQQQQQ